MDLPVNLTSFSLSTPSSLEPNRSLGAEDLRPSRPFLSVFRVLVLTLLGFLAAATFAWNLLVLATILRVRTFHRVPHNLVASMAISDVLVAALVMPLSLVHELSGRRWQLGRRLCQLWIVCDVLCCTASIWNVTAIALDRYWSITRHLEYTLRARKRVSNVMIVLTWALSAVISLAPPLFGWGETYSELSEECQVSREPSYTVFSTVGAFYLPLCVVLFVYWKIYKAAKFRVGSRKTNSVSPVPEAVEVGATRIAKNISLASLLSSQHTSPDVYGRRNSPVWGDVGKGGCSRQRLPLLQVLNYRASPVLSVSGGSFSYVGNVGVAIRVLKSPLWH